MVGGLLPVGPLHPDLAVIAIAAGLAVALIARRRPWRWSTGVLVASACVLIHRQGDVLLTGYQGRPDAGFAIAATLVVGVVGLLLRPRPVDAAFAVVAASAAAWTIVPDTEAPLVAALVTAVALVRPPAPTRSGLAGVALVLPFVPRWWARMVARRVSGLPWWSPPRRWPSGWPGRPGCGGSGVSEPARRRQWRRAERRRRRPHRPRPRRSDPPCGRATRSLRCPGRRRRRPWRLR